MRIETILSLPKRAVVMVALMCGGFLLLSILATTFLSPAYGLVGIGVLAGALVALYFALSLRKFVWLLLITKPLIDLTWRWRFANVAEQGVNIQTLVAMLGIAVTGLAIFLWKRRLVLDVKVILFLTCASLSILLTPVLQGINELVRLLAGVSFFFTAGVVLDKEKLFDRFAKYFVLTVSVPVALSFLQKAQILPYDYWDWIGGHPVGRVSGTYQHPPRYDLFSGLCHSTGSLSVRQKLFLLSLSLIFVVVHWPISGSSGIYLSPHSYRDNWVGNLAMDGLDQEIRTGHIIGCFRRTTGFLAK